MSWDIKLTDQDITVPMRQVRGEDLVIQQCTIRTRTFRGEWRYDSRTGVPWAQWLDEAQAPLPQIEDFLKAEYEDVEGVRRADVTAELNDDLTIEIEALIYLDQADSPGLQLTASLVDDEPAVIRVFRIGGIL